MLELTSVLNSRLPLRLSSNRVLDLQAGSAALELRPLQPFRSVTDYADLGIRLWNAYGIGIEDEDWTGRLFSMLRQFRQDYGYVLASAEVMLELVNVLADADPVLDAGSGTGYMAQELARHGVCTYAIDHCDFGLQREQATGYPMHEVCQRDALGDARTAVFQRFGAVLLTWPPYDTRFALDIATAMLPGQLLVYEGEDKGGCTADDVFFSFMSAEQHWEFRTAESARLNAVHVTFPTLHDRWFVWRKIQ
jgi:hypothetical protein